MIVGRTSDIGGQAGGGGMHGASAGYGCSNGAGKTALVMAPLWALSGETDRRPEGASSRGLRGVDVRARHFSMH